MVRIQFSIQLAYDVAPPGADFIFNLHCAHTRHQTLLTEQLQLNQSVASTLFIDPATHRGLPTFAAMALTIAAITAAYCLTLCAFANAVAEKVRSHRTLARWLERAAGVFLVGFGIRLVKD